MKPSYETLCSRLIEPSAPRVESYKSFYDPLREFYTTFLQKVV